MTVVYLNSAQEANDGADREEAGSIVILATEHGGHPASLAGPHLDALRLA